MSGEGGNVNERRRAWSSRRYGRRGQSRARESEGTVCSVWGSSQHCVTGQVVRCCRVGCPAEASKENGVVDNGLCKYVGEGPMAFVMQPRFRGRRRVW